MTCTARVWGEALLRLQEEIPDFAYDAWIAPLDAKLGEDCVILGCPTSFHRDRVRIHYADRLEACLAAALEAAGLRAPGSESPAMTIRILGAREFAEVPGPCLALDGTAPLEVGGAGIRKEITSDSLARCATDLGTKPVDTCPEPGTTSVRIHLPTSSHPAVLPQAAQLPPRPSECSTPNAAPGVAAALRMPASSDFQIRPRAVSSRRTSTPRPARAADPQSSTQGELPFSFESFVVGPCNALAREASLALARERQRSLNQLYLGGESGMGKTHLARATAAEARRHGAAGGGSGSGVGRGVVYTSAEQFTSEFVSAMRNGRSDEFKRRYRAPIGLLVVEDVQFFSGRAKTQLELFHTVQHVLDAGGRVLLTGDRPPRDLTGLDDRMRAQMGRGFVAELEAPDALVRRNILRAKAAAGGVKLPADCLDLLVESTEGSVRDIESVLIQVVTTSSLLGHPIDLDLTRDAIALKTAANPRLAPRTIAVSEIVRIVSAFFGKRPEALASRSRRRDVLVPRQLAMYLAHRYTEASFGEIGRALGRDHPSVRNAIQRIERQVLENAPVRYQVEALSERIDQTLKQRAEGGGRPSQAPGARGAGDA
jgi:chromosomal replication initiator protein